MHEMSIAVELVRQLETLAVERDIERIESVDVTAGVLRQIVPDALQTAFTVIVEGTCAEGAKLNLEIVPARVRCRRCEREFALQGDAYFCEQCGQADVEIVEGNDILLTSVTCELSEGESCDET